MTTCSFLTALAVSGWLMLAVPVCAQEVDEVKAFKVKAAYLYQFAKFVEWPEDSFEDDKAPVVIGVLGRDPFGLILDKTVEDKTVDGRKFVVKRFQFRKGENTEGLRRCHILYISLSERGHLKDVFDVLGKSNVLIVGEEEDFAPTGGMIGLVLEEGRVAFHVNQEAVKRTRIKVSAKLLSLAKIVRTRGGNR